MADRQVQIDEVDHRLEEARDEQNYFTDVIKYMNAKLVVLSTIEKSLNPKEVMAQEGGDWEFYQDIQPEKDGLWDLLYDLNNQLQAIKDQADAISFEKFRLNNGFAAEDAFNAEDDLLRQRAWFEEVEGDIQALEEEKEALKEADGTVSASNQARFDEIGGPAAGELQPLF